MCSLPISNYFAFPYGYVETHKHKNEVRGDVILNKELTGVTEFSER